MDRDEIKTLLPSKEQNIFEDIVTSRVLGANNHIKLIGDMIVGIAQSSDNGKEEILTKIRKIADFFMETRGAQSRAIYNAIQYYIKDLDWISNQEETQMRATITNIISSYSAKAQLDLKILVEYGKRLTEQMDTILIFDYSSTVNDFITGIGRKMTVYIPESRALDGGKPFVKTAVLAGHEVHFIPDTTMLLALKKCQAAFMGAETVYPDGTVFNTVGSDMLAVLCEKLHLPLYVLTPLIKVDIRPVYGYIRCSPMPFDYGVRLSSHWDEAERKDVDFRGCKLLEIEPGYIKAFITEEGIIPPNAFFSIAIKYAKSLEGV